MRGPAASMRRSLLSRALLLSFASTHALPKPPPPACRYCGKVQPLNSTGAKWRRVEAPADTGGRNASVPAPLRVAEHVLRMFALLVRDAPIHGLWQTREAAVHVMIGEARAKLQFLQFKLNSSQAQHQHIECDI